MVSLSLFMGTESLEDLLIKITDITNDWVALYLNGGLVLIARPSSGRLLGLVKAFGSGSLVDN